MIRFMAYAFVLALFLLSPLAHVSAQTTPYSRTISVGADLIQYAPTGDQTFPGMAPITGGIRLGYTKYLRPGFDFRTELHYTPGLQDAMAPESRVLPRYSFRYALIFKLNNGLFFRETAGFAPYLLLGAGGSYHAERPDAFTPFGGGIDLRMFKSNFLRVQASKNISWNQSPQTWQISLMLVHKFPGKPLPQPIHPPAVLPLQEEEPPLVATEADPNPSGTPVLEEGMDQDTLGFPPPTEEEMVESDFASTVTDSIPPDETYESPADPIAQAPYPTEPGLPFEEQPQDTASSGTGVVSLPDNEAPENLAVAPCGSIELPVIQFSYRSADLSTHDKERLDAFAERLKTCPGLILELEGHADEYSDPDDNLVLSIRRAYNIKYYLVYEHRISQQRIISQGAGSRDADSHQQTVTFLLSS